ncbi:AMP-dependent synthetase/ligase [Bifidobacterium callitrichos]|uniref:Acyl-CoA synthetase n=1 Tax=Bifidobacterium callitrichos DSM 23973 TaxID=1437609 RepID=A0A087AD23_9BIFI|nr:AMP-dependent synthetase/ligase [Bifidobacterium callitrichos]KFI56673.1 long-chain-fatty-acid--CoA ligase [Bifidobacterium callitrichos DSM 23973]
MIKEYLRPLEQPIDTDGNLFSILDDRAARTPDKSLVEYKDPKTGEWKSFTAVEFRDKVIALAKGLIARGVMPGDCVSVISKTRWEWTALDMAIMSIGALTVPVYETNSSVQVSTIFNDSNVKMAFAENDMQRDKIESVRDRCPDLGDVYVIDFGALDTIEEYGRTVTDAEFREREQAVRGTDLATIVYTSGSTGTPKGIELSHGNFLFITYSGVRSMPDIAMPEYARLWLFLPLAHVFARYMQFFCFAGNVTLGLSGNLKTILADFAAFKPTFILAVPRIFEKIYNAASQKAGAGLKGRIFAGATGVAREWSVAQQSGDPIPFWLGVRHAAYSKLVYKSIMQVFGGHVEYAVCGGAPLDKSIAHFFNGIGLPLLEGYGMTETCAPASVNPTSGYRIGTIGLPMQGTAVGIAEDGELCIKSPAVCVGYHNHPEITAQQIVDGWLHTGDLGSLDDDGFVTVTGRKKDLIITAGGKNVSPGELEASVMTSPVVNQCVVVGDRKPFIAAIIALDLAETNAWLESQGAAPCRDLAEASRNPIVHAEVERAVNQADELVSRAESIRKFEIVPDDFTEDNGLVTASMKARREAITERYRDLIDNVIYAGKR